MILLPTKSGSSGEVDGQASVEMSDPESRMTSFRRPFKKNVQPTLFRIYKRLKRGLNGYMGGGGGFL